MTNKEYKAVIEAILFTMGESVELEKIADTIELDKNKTKKLIEEMMKEKMGVEDEDIGKVFLQIVEPRSDTDKKVAEFIDILLEEMVKSREKGESRN